MRIWILFFLTLAFFKPANAGQYPFVITNDIRELLMTSMDDEAISTEVTQITGLNPFKGEAFCKSSTGAYSMTSSATSTVAVSTTTDQRIPIGLKDDGMTFNRKEFFSSRWRGDWLFRIYYR